MPFEPVESSGTFVPLQATAPTGSFEPVEEGAERPPTYDEVKARRAAGAQLTDAELRVLHKGSDTPVADFMSGAGSAVKEVASTAARAGKNYALSYIPGTANFDVSGGRRSASLLEGATRGTFDLGNIGRMAFNKAKDALASPFRSDEEEFQAFKARHEANEKYNRLRAEGFDEKGNLFFPNALKPIADAQLPGVAEGASYILDPTLPFSLGTTAAAKVGGRTLGETLAKGAANVVEKSGTAAKAVGSAPRKIIEGVTEKLVGPELAQKAGQLTKAGEVLSVPAALSGVATPVTGTLAAAKGLEVAGATAEKVGQFAGKVADKPGASQFSRLMQVAKDPTAPLWMKTLALGLERSGVAGATRLGVETAKGAAIGAGVGTGLGLASAETAEELGAATGSGAAIGGAGRTAGYPLVKAQKLVQAKRADLIRFYRKQQSFGAAPELLKNVGDDVMLAAATLDKVFEGKLDVRFLDGENYGKISGNAGSSAFFDPHTRQILINAESVGRSPGNSFYHELGHALAVSEVASKPEIKTLIDNAMGDKGRIQDAKVQYAAALTRARQQAEGLPPVMDNARWISDPKNLAEVQAELTRQQAMSEKQFGDSDFWIYSELFAEAALRSLKGVDIFSDILNSGSLRSRALQFGQQFVEGLGVKFDKSKPGSFFANFDDVLDNKELRGLVRDYVRARNEFISGKSEAAPQVTQATREMMGRHEAVPFRPMPDGSQGNDFAYQTADGTVIVRQPSDVRRIEQARAQEVNRAVEALPPVTTPEPVSAPKPVTPDPVKPAKAAPSVPVDEMDPAVAADAERTPPVLDADDEVRPRRTISGLLQITGRRLGDWFYNLRSFSAESKANAKLVESAIRDGRTISFWYQAASTGSGSEYVKNFKRLKGGVMVSHREVVPFAITVSTPGTVRLAGGRTAKKGGNVLIASLDLTSAAKRIIEWQGRGKLDLWNGDAGAFKADLIAYLKNHAEGRPGDVGIGESKKNVLNTFIVGDNRAHADKNPLRNSLTGSDKTGVIRTFRIDRIEAVKPIGEQIGSAEYNKKVLNLTPDSTADEVIASAKAAREQSGGGVGGETPNMQFSPSTEVGQLAGKPLPHAVGPGGVRLIHFSNHNDLKTVNPKYFGTAKANPNDRRGANKTYFFVEGSDMDIDAQFFGNSNMYGAVVDGSRLYDLRRGKEDVLNYFGTINREEADDNVRKKGYVGILVDSKDGRHVVMLYRPVKVAPLGQAKNAKRAVSNVQFSPDGRGEGSDAVRSIADVYTKAAGLTREPFAGNEKVDEARASRIADAYAAAKHDPDSPEVKKAYGSFVKETMDQYKAIVDAGYTMEPWTKPGQPYANSAEMRADVNNNKHLWFFPTEGGFGSGPTDVNNHPLLTPIGVKVGGKDLVANDVFRAVHDFFGHAKEGYEFGPRGEYNAYLAHSRMYSDDASPAMAAETLGQNSWVNFGPHMRSKDGKILKKGDEGYIPITERPFAEQKATLLPPELVHEATRTPVQFSPATELGQSFVKNGYDIVMENFSKFSADVLVKPKNGRTEIGRLTFSIDPHKPEAQVASVHVRDDFRGRQIAEVMYRELAAHLQKEDVKLLSGDAVHPAVLKIREKVFGPHVSNDEIFMDHKTGQKMYRVVSEVSKDRQYSPTEEKKVSGGASFAKFFHNTENTPAGGAKYSDIRDVLQKPTTGFDEELNAYLRFGSNFQKHIATSIPGFVDTRIRAMKGLTRLASRYGQGGDPVRMFDITTSEGYFPKAWASLAQKRGVDARADGLDALPAFKETFDKVEQVPNVKFLLEAWGETFDDPSTGQKIPQFQPGKEKYDIVHEGMGFQFFTSDRKENLKTVKNMMTPDGVFITMEKFKNPDYAEREKLKDEFKSKFYDQSQLAAKQKEVLKSGDDKASAGMADYQIDRQEYEKILSETWDHVAQFWSSGNFAGYIASDDAAAIKTFVRTVGDTKTKFSVEETPRAISAQQYSVDSELPLEKLPARNIKDPSILVTLEPKSSTERAANAIARQEIRKRIQMLPDSAAKVRVRRALQVGFENVMEYLNREKTDKNFDSGRGWYGKDIEAMERVTVDLFPEAKDPATMGLFKAMLAVLSPSMKPKENYRSGAEGFATYLKAGQFSDKSLVRLNDKDEAAALGMNAERGAAHLNGLLEKFDGDRNKVMNYLTTVQPESKTYGAMEFGPKVGAFFLNLMGLSDEVTVDLWATRTWNRWMNTIFRGRREGKTVIQDAPTDADRPLIQQAFTDIATKVSEETGEKLTPMEVQAILWFYEKDLYEHFGASVDRGLFGDAARDYHSRPLHLSQKPIKLSEKVKKEDPAQQQLF